MVQYTRLNTAIMLAGNYGQVFIPFQTIATHQLIVKLLSDEDGKYNLLLLIQGDDKSYTHLLAEYNSQPEAELKSLSDFLVEVYNSQQFACFIHK